MRARAGADIQDFTKGGFRPAMRKVGGGEGGAVRIRPYTKSGEGERGCCPLQARYEKRGGGRGGGALHFRHDTPLSVSASGVGFVCEYDVDALLACYTLTKELYTSNSISNYICVMQWRMQDLGGGGGVSTRDPHTFS